MGEEILQAQVYHLDVDVVVRDGAPGVDLDMADQLAVGHDEGHRIQLHHPMVQSQRQLDLAQGKAVRRGHAVGAVVKGGVHHPHLFHTEGGVRQEAVLGGQTRGRGLLLRRGAGAARRGADQGTEVSVVQVARMQVGGDVGTAGGRIRGQIALQVAVADAAVDVAEVIALLVAHQAALQGVGARRREGDAGQAIEIAEVRTRDIDGGVDLAEVERLGQDAVGDDMGLAGVQVAVEMVGLVAAHVDQRPAGDVQRERIAIDRARTDEGEGPGALAAHLHVVLLRLDRAAQRQVATLIDHPQPAVMDDEVLDRRQLERLGGLGIAAPVGLIASAAIEPDVGILQVDQWQFDLADQQRQEFYRNGELVDLGQIAPALHPARIADREPADHSRGRPGKQAHLEMSGDGYRPAAAP